MTVMIMRTMLTRAMALALLKLSIERYKESGNDMVMTQKIMIKDLEERNDPSKPGRMETRTCGIVSPMTTMNAHIPPNAKAP
jgi:hypothetical protein